MNVPESVEPIVATLLGCAVLAASLRLVLRTRAGHPHAMRCVALLSLQALAAVLLHLVLFPPSGLREAGVLTVLAEDADTGRAAGPTVALPEYAGTGAQRVPDLASALRRHPGTTRVVVHGAYLPWRDHDAARGVDVQFEPAPMPAGLVELQVPRALVAGQRVELRGRVAGVEQVQLELTDPAGQRLARVPADADGGFRLPLALQAAGVVDFTLRVVDGGGAVVDETPVPLSIAETAATRILLLAGAPSAELRELRRWATDAGIHLDSRIRLSRDASLGQPPDVGSEALDGFDLVLLDLRTWRSFDTAQRDALRAGVERGLGVLLRMDDTPGDEDSQSLQALGFAVSPLEVDAGGVLLHPDHLGRTPGSDADAREDGPGDATRLTHRPLRVDADDAAVLLRSDTGQPLALWRSRGLGRVALWWLDDTYPLVLQAEPRVHANLWSAVVSTLARARDDVTIDTGTDAGTWMRRTLCGLGMDAQVITPGGDRIGLVTDGRGCAGFWPEMPGWHVVQSEGGRANFHVDGASNLRAYAAREATHRLAARPWRASAAEQLPTPGSPWPWFFAFVAAVGVLWWLERRRPRAAAASAGKPGRSDAR